MSNPNKAKGTRWETALVNVSNAFFGARYGLKARRVAQEGHGDTGDIHGVSPFVFQAKDDKAHRFSEWLDHPSKGARAQARRAGEPYAAVIVKRLRKPVADAYALMIFGDLVRMILRLRRAEALLAEHAPEAFLAHAAATTEEVDLPVALPSE